MKHFVAIFLLCNVKSFILLFHSFLWHLGVFQFETVQAAETQFQADVLGEGLDHVGHVVIANGHNVEPKLGLNDEFCHKDSSWAKVLLPNQKDNNLNDGEDLFELLITPSHSKIKLKDDIP